ncbi:MAG: alpha-amylase family glycosyl hydrolase, partial [Bacteroidota bacterium]
MKRFLFLAAILCGATWLPAQILTVTPTFPSQNDTVTIVYDATEGNGALTGISPVYAHTGLITNQSTSPTDWQLVQGNWGTADANVVMTDLGNNLHEIKYHIPTYYNLPAGDTAFKMAFVFRNADGSVVGRDPNGDDIFYDLFNNSQLSAVFNSPAQRGMIVDPMSSINLVVSASNSATLTVTDNGNQVFSVTGTTHTQALQVTGTGDHEVILLADDGNFTASDTFHYTVLPSPSLQALPAGTELGINYLNDSTVRLRLFAPNKGFVYVVGEWTDYLPSEAYHMHKTPDQATYWIDLTGLNPGQEYAFQYNVDDEVHIADPYSELVLDPDNDGWIPPSTYPNLRPYPSGKIDGFLTIIFPGKAPYNWQVTNFQKPAKTDLVIYELLMRDFLAAHDYETLIDTLDYLENLGINAIELMPVNEFEGNDSWGYNPSFHMATDKYYGTIEALKDFIDEAHSRGIAVILDVVYNHAFSQSPLCQLYWDDANFKPAANNVWLNVDARHDFNVGYDFDHSSNATKDWVDRVMKYWLEEFKIDGFRFDLS